MREQKCAQKTVDVQRRSNAVHDLIIFRHEGTVIVDDGVEVMSKSGCA